MTRKNTRSRRATPEILATPRPRKHAAPAAAPTWKNQLLLFGLFIGLTLLVYASGLAGGFVWDDDNYVENNLQLRTLGGLGRIWTQLGAVPQYYPLVFTSFWLEYHLWGLRTPGYHLVNIALHGCSAALLFLILKKLKPALALPVALLFVAHPVMVESVQWITERKNTMSLCFALGSLLALVPLLSPWQPEGTWRGGLSVRRYALGLLLFAGAMLSKTVACSLPAVVLVLAWYTDGSRWWKRLPALLPFFVIGLALAYVTVHTERYVVGTAIEGTGLTPPQRVLVAGKALWFYAAKLVAPYPIMFIYPRWDVPSLPAWQYVFPVAAVAALLTAWALRGRIGRGLAALLFIYAGVLVPALGFVDVYPFKFSFVADHFQYLAAPAFLCVIASALLALFDKMNMDATAARNAFVGVAVVLGVMSAVQARTYLSAECLYRDTIAKNPVAAMPLNNLGQILARQGKLEEAEGHYRSAIASEPDFVGAHFNLAEVLMRTGRSEEARQRMLDALALDPENPRLHFHVGLAYARQRDADLAIAMFQKAVELKPDYVDPLVELGNIYAQTGHPELAIPQYEKAVAMRPDYSVAYANLANALATRGDPEAALKHYEAALRLDPADPQTWNNYSVTLERLGRGEESRKAREKAEQMGRSGPRRH